MVGRKVIEKDLLYYSKEIDSLEEMSDEKYKRRLSFFRITANNKKLQCCSRRNLDFSFLAHDGSSLKRSKEMTLKETSTLGTLYAVNGDF